MYLVQFEVAHHSGVCHGSSHQGLWMLPPNFEAHHLDLEAGGQLPKDYEGHRGGQQVDCRAVTGTSA